MGHSRDKLHGIKIKKFPEYILDLKMNLEQNTILDFLLQIFTPLDKYHINTYFNHDIENFYLGTYVVK